jgi:hypothetical protein
MSFLAIQLCALVLFVALAVIVGKSLMAAERNGVGVSGIFRRSMRDGFLRPTNEPRHGGNPEDPMHLHDDLPPLPFHPQNGGGASYPDDGRILPGEGV